MKVLIIEDEREIARALSEDLKKLQPQIEIVGVTSDISSSISAINSNKDLDVIFADIKIDDGMSFRVFEQVDTEATVVFTTAYDEYALKAFDYNCIDYLLKPISIEGLQRALQRCEKRLSPIDHKDLRRISSEIISGAIGYKKKIILEKGQDTVIRSVVDLCYVLTERGYVKAFFKDGFTSMVNSSLAGLSESLDPTKFLRLNRQVLVNLECIDRISHGAGRDYIVKLKPPFEKEAFVITADTKTKILNHIG